MRTIFITSFHSLISRNILQTDVLNLLLKEKVKIFIFCPIHKKEYFKKEFEKEGVQIMGIENYPLSKRESILKQAATALLPTCTITLNRKARFYKDKKLPSFLIFMLISKTIARSKNIRKLYQKIFFKFYNRNIFGEFFKKYKPDLVFSTDIFHNDDTRFITEAKKNKIKVIGMIRSWDNTTNYRLLPATPDKLIAHNQIIKDEVIEFHGINKNSIYISGIPQFDYYLNYKPGNKSKFLNKTGFEDNQKIILFAPMGEKFIDGEWQILQILHDEILSGNIEGGPHIIVRFPPGDIMDTDKLKLSDKIKIYFDKPGIKFDARKRKDIEMDKKDMSGLADSLYYADLLINVASTLCIDMAAFGKPIICPKFNVDENVEYFKSAAAFCAKHHSQYLTKDGGCKLVENKKEFINCVNQYLKNPQLDKEKRIILLNEQCFKFDGQASKRVANYIIKHINEDGR